MAAHASVTEPSERSSLAPRVSLHGVSKRFLRGVRHDTVRDLVPAVIRRWLGRGAPARREPFWALHDVSFDVGAGEALGIIGPNGSGKSTILRLIAGILRADEGSVIVRGSRAGRPRIGALVELAAGFHYDLTGRENVFLQGAVLGMRRGEIAGKFEQIVEFAEIAEFIDTPVKRYSSGMIARLGFSVAAHLDPEIMIVDEVLAVGDIRFQQKAFARLREVVARDVPTIVVSHQLHRITELCERAVLLTHGRVLASGPAAECVARYVQEATTEPGDDTAAVRVFDVVPSQPCVSPGGRLGIRLTGHVAEHGDGDHLVAGVRVRVLPREEIVFAVNCSACGITLPRSGPFELDIDLQMNVPPGLYRVQGAAWDVRDGRELHRGATAMITVEGAVLTYGPVFADPRMRIRCG